MMQLYPDQVELVKKCRAAFRKHKHVCLQLPTGGGKTVIAAHIAQLAAQKGPLVFLVHRQELVRQTVRTLKAAGIEPHICAAGSPKYIPAGYKALVATIQTLGRRLKEGHVKITPPHLVVVDECHHARATTWAQVLEFWPDAYRLGLTATPRRLDGKGLHAHFQTLVIGPSVDKLVKLGRLAPHNIRVAEAVFDRKALANDKPDFSSNKIAQAAQAPVIAKIADSVQLECIGRRTLIFAPSVAASKQVAKELTAAGWAAAHLDGQTPDDRRTRVLRMWESGKIQAVSNVDLFSEGMDAPGCDAVVLARPTKSITMHLQQIGRALRYLPGKEALILDLAGNVDDLGPPDEFHDWHLFGSEESKPKQKKATKLCPECHAVYPVHLTACPQCGYMPEGRPALKQIDSEIIDFEVATNPSRKEQHKNVKKLVAVGRMAEARSACKRYGFKPGYAYQLSLQLRRARF